VSVLTLAHSPSITLTHRCPLHQSSHAVRVHFALLANGAQMSSHDRPFLGCIARDGESNPNITLSPILLSRLLISFSPFCNLSPCPLCVNRGLLCSYPLLLRFYVSLSLFTPNRTVLALLSPLLSPTASPSSGGSKTLRRGLPANNRGEWLGSGGL
jgi:hypothetical protein